MKLRLTQLFCFTLIIDNSIVCQHIIYLDGILSHEAFLACQYIQKIHTSYA